MLSFKQFLNERFVNLISDADKKSKYAQQVWDILQYSYKDIGGIKGSGFGSVQEMVEKIPFWKLVTKNGEVHAVALYKDKGGRKSVAVGVKEGSLYGKQKMQEIYAADLERSYGEKSKAALGMLMKTVPWNVLQSFTYTSEQVIRGFEPDAIPVKDVDRSEWPEDAERTLQRFPQLIDYGYLREIKGSLIFKVMFGTPNLKIRR